MFDALINNPNLARILVVAIAAEASKDPSKLNRQDFLVGFGRLIRALSRQRSAFMDELRTMERLGPDEYLQRLGKRLRKDA